MQRAYMLDTCILFLIKGRYIIRQYLLKILVKQYTY
nr:MAG TPA: hypothetical protein [Bacteriophage sp.]